jgi:Transposase/Transposase IS116/IS110/IS902 family
MPREEAGLIFVGVDWAEAHHEVCVLDQAGAVLGHRRVPDGVAGLAQLHGLVADQASEPAEVVVGIELDRGLLISALVAAGYQVVAVNPLAASRYRERHGTSGAKSDRGDAKVLADLVRTDRHNHRPVAGDSDLAEAIRVLARAHQSAIWSRQRQLNSLRSALRAFYPAALAAFGTDLASSDALAVLALAPTPEQGRQLSRAKLAAALARGGRQRNLEQRAAHIQATLRAPQLATAPPISQAYGVVAHATVGLLASLNQQITALEEALGEGSDTHPDAKTIRSLPGLGMVLGARVLGEFGDDQTRFPTVKSRKNYAGSAPITKASGRSLVVLARHARNRRLADALEQWAFCSLTQSPGARRYYDQLRARNKTHRQALGQLANRWVGILHTCLERSVVYDEHLAWGHLYPAPA